MPTEQEILKVIREFVPGSKKYLFDDAAIIACPNQICSWRKNNFIVTTDSLVEDVHFVQTPCRDVPTSPHQDIFYTPEEIGWKALAVNLSDIAAMGGKPLYALISLSLPKSIQLNWIKRFYKGLITCAKKYKTQIIGGNLTRSKELIITVTVIGETAVKTPRRGVFTVPCQGILRSNAKPGDLVFASGTFGDAVFHNYKTKIVPQITLGQKIAQISKGTASLMDASDGLADCLIQIAEQSKVKIIIDEAKIPISNEVKKIGLKSKILSLALYGGEDYQLVGTCQGMYLPKLKGIKIIGAVTKGKGAFLKQNNNRLVKLDMKKTYEHFK